jgi:hypothetical protein
MRWLTWAALVAAGVLAAVSAVLLYLAGAPDVLIDPGPERPAISKVE